MQWELTIDLKPKQLHVLMLLDALERSADMSCTVLRFFYTIMGTKNSFYDQEVFLSRGEIFVIPS